MTIRKSLLIAFLLASLIPALLLTTLAFYTASGSVRSEIERGLLVQSASVSQDIDKMLFERLQNAMTWQRLEVMQDIQVNDVDKRLAHFLSDLKGGYRDVYDELACIDREGRVVASSEPGAIGLKLTRPEAMLRIDRNIWLEPLHLTEGSLNDSMTIRAMVPSEFGPAAQGELLLRFNWNQIYNILDQAAQGDRMVVLLDKHNRIIAASDDIRSKHMLLTELPADWVPKGENNGVAELDGAPFDLHEVTVGYDRSRGFQHFPGFGWTTLVIQPSSQAFIPVQHLAWVFLALLAVVSLIATVFSMLVAKRIARPITALTAFTKRFSRDQALPPPPAETGGEIGELTTTFVETVRALEKSRADLVRASKLAVLGELSAVMAHEIRTPIGILRSSAQMLAREPNLSEEARELTSFIESETDRLNRLVSTLLDSARPRMPQFEMHDMQALIRHCIDLLAGQAEKKSITVEMRFDSARPEVSCDAEQMTQVLLNLILNALQILPMNGRVSVTCKDAGETMTLMIADDGPGIPEENQASVFDPFFSRREGGVGLGLAVVQQIVAAHHGTIEAGTSEMGGALFTITLPIENQP